nr:[FeFe] hydrogenase H-cluster maturation GTPase HydF [bacterium]
AVLVSIAGREIVQAEQELLNIFAEKNIPFIIACNKSDLLSNIPGNTCTCNTAELAQNASACANTSAPTANTSANLSERTIYVSAKTGLNINALKEKLGSFAKPAANNKRLVADLLNPGETAVLVIPIDESAPKGRLILPQQQVIRDLLENGNIITCCRDTELKETLAALSTKPALVITDSQAFGRVSRDTPNDILMTSFSILFARYKGSLETLIQGASKLSQLKDGDKVLISEGCTHHRQCNDIGSVKLPGWIEKFCQAKPQFSFSSGGEFPADLKDYAIIVHCGGCMLNEKEMQARMRKAKEAGVPIVNYGIAIAEMHGILERSLRPFPAIHKLYYS